jgi:hypothetical protein
MTDEYDVGLHLFEAFKHYITSLIETPDRCYGKTHRIFEPGSSDDQSIGVHFLQGQRRFFATVSRLDLGRVELPVRKSRRTLSQRAKWPGRDFNYTFPSSVEVRNVWNYNSTLKPRLIFESRVNSLSYFTCTEVTT